MNILKNIKLIFLILVTTLATFIFSVFSNYNTMKNQILEEEKNSAVLSTLKVSSILNKNIGKMRTIGQTVAFFSESLKYDNLNSAETKKVLEKALINIVQNNPQIETAYTFLNPTELMEEKKPYIIIYKNSLSNLVIDKLESTDYWSENWYKFGEKAKKFTWTEPYFDKITNLKLISGVQNLEDSNGKTLGFSGIDILIDTINMKIENIHIKENQKVYLISNKGNYIYHTNKKNILKNALNNPKDELYFLNKYISKNQKQGFIKNKFNDKSSYYFYYKLPSLDWYVVLIEDSTIIDSKLYSIFLQSIITLLLGNILIILLFILIFKHKKSQERIKNLAFYNSNTNLPNRNYIDKNLSHFIAKLVDDKKTAAIMFLDMDNFKAINDTLGHCAGDEFLKQAAQRFKSCLKDEDFAFHISGDEFLFLINSIKNKKEAGYFAQTLLDVFHVPFYIDRHEIQYITASIGIALIDDDGDNLHTLLNNADTAMYFAKRDGKNRYEFYNSTMSSNTYETLKLKNELKAALANKEFKVYYQPKVNAKSGEIVGLEALVRWIKPDGTIIPPFEFIPFAEKNNLITPISEYIIKEVCIQNKLWQITGFKKIPIAINLSAQQINDLSLLEKIKNIIKELDLSPEYLEIEITESMVMKNFEKSIEVLRKFKDLKIKIALDDFGTGYSSLSYLRMLPIDTVKIDKSFIDDITTDNKRRIIVASIINLLHNMDLNIVAEGIELEEQLHILKKYNCDEIQGYLFSKPLDVREIEVILTKGFFEIPESELSKT